MTNRDRSNLPETRNAQGTVPERVPSAAHAHSPLDGPIRHLLELPAPPDSVEHAIAEYLLAQRMLSVQRPAHELAHDFRNLLMHIASLVLQLEKSQPTEAVIQKGCAIRSVLATGHDGGGLSRVRKH